MALPLGASAAWAQVTSGPAAVHPEGDDTNVSGAGSVSVTCTLAAVEGPAFDTMMR